MLRLGCPRLRRALAACRACRPAGAVVAAAGHAAGAAACALSGAAPARRAGAASEETPAKTPLWLILLRMALVALVILALAHPLLNPSAHAGRQRAAGARRRRRLDRGAALGRAPGHARPADRPGGARRAGASSCSARRRRRRDRAAGALGAAPERRARRGRRARARALAGRPRARRWSGSPELGVDGSAAIVWLSDGIDDGSARDFAAALLRCGSLRVLTEGAADLPRLLAAGGYRRQGPHRHGAARRCEPAGRGRRARGRRGRAAAGAPGRAFAAGRDRRASPISPMPSELRNRAPRSRSRARPRPARCCCSTSAGAAARSASSARAQAEQRSRCSSGAYYLDTRAGTLQRGAARRCRRRCSRATSRCWSFPTCRPSGAEEKAAPVKWIEAAAWCCASPAPHLAEQADDDLLPVTLRRGGRTLGGALSWETAGAAGAVRADSPFAGLDDAARRHRLAPGAGRADRRPRRQDLGAAGRRHAARHRREARQGLARAGPHHRRSRMVEPAAVGPVRRHAAAHRGAVSRAWPARPTRRCRRWRRSTASAGCSAPRPRPSTIAAGAFRRDHRLAAPIRPASTARPTQRRALNLAPARSSASRRSASCRRASRGKPTRAAARSISAPSCSARALALALHRSRHRLCAARPAAAAHAARAGAAPRRLVLALVLAAAPAQARRRRFRHQGDERAPARLCPHRHSRGRRRDRAPASPGSATSLNRRTAVEAAEPMAVDVEQDELIFFPLLYWPVAAGRGAAVAAGASSASTAISPPAAPSSSTRAIEGDARRRPARRRSRRCAALAAGSTCRRWCRCRPITC